MMALFRMFISGSLFLGLDWLLRQVDFCTQLCQGCSPSHSQALVQSWQVIGTWVHLFSGWYGATTNLTSWLLYSMLTNILKWYRFYLIFAHISNDQIGPGALCLEARPSSLHGFHRQLFFFDVPSQTNTFLLHEILQLGQEEKALQSQQPQLCNMWDPELTSSSFCAFSII